MIDVLVTLFPIHNYTEVYYTDKSCYSINNYRYMNKILVQLLVEPSSVNQNYRQAQN